jgi:hypothetical protein
VRRIHPADPARSKPGFPENRIVDRRRTWRVQSTDAVAAAATALALAGSMPQVRRLVRTGDITGVSLTGAAIGVVSETAWVAYTSHEALWSAVPMPLLMVLANLVLAGLIVRAGAGPTRAISSAATWSGLLGAASAFGGWSTLGLLLAFAYAVQVAPCVSSAYAVATPSGIAPGRWAALLFECALWGWYGVARTDVAISTFAVVGAGAAIAILARCRVRSDRRSPRPEPSRRRASGVRPARAALG